MSGKEKVLNLVTKVDKENEKYHQELEEVAQSFMDLVKSRNIKEFVITYVTDEGNVAVSTYAKDMIGSLGMMELGKLIIMNQVE